MRNGKIFCSLLAGMLFLTPLLGHSFRIVPAHAAPIELKVAHADSPDFWTSRKGGGAVLFKNLVEADTGGAVEVKVFAAGQLGGERELAEATKLGTIQMTFVSGAIANYFKEAQVADIPYLFSSAPVAWKVFDGWFGKELGEECLKKMGCRVLAYGEVGFRNFTNSIRPIRTPADLKGLKIRVQETPVYISLVKSLGASPTPIPWPEIYTALQQKVTDGQENPVSVFKFAKLYEVQKYMILDEHTYGVDFLIINEKFYQSLPREIKDIIKINVHKTALMMRGIQQINSTMGVAELKEKGMEIYSPTVKEKAMFKEATQKPVLEYIEKQVGKIWVDKIMKATKEVEAELSK